MCTTRLSSFWRDVDRILNQLSHIFFFAFLLSLFRLFCATPVDPRNLSGTLDPVFLTGLDFCQTPLEFRHIALCVKIYIRFQYLGSFYIYFI